MFPAAVFSATPPPPPNAPHAVRAQQTDRTGGRHAGPLPAAAPPRPPRPPWPPPSESLGRRRRPRRRRRRPPSRLSSRLRGPTGSARVWCRFLVENQWCEGVPKKLFFVGGLILKEQIGSLEYNGAWRALRLRSCPGGTLHATPPRAHPSHPLLKVTAETCFFQCESSLPNPTGSYPPRVKLRLCSRFRSLRLRPCRHREPTFTVP